MLAKNMEDTLVASGAESSEDYQCLDRISQIAGDWGFLWRRKKGSSGARGSSSLTSARSRRGYYER